MYPSPEGASSVADSGWVQRITVPHVVGEKIALGCDDFDGNGQGDLVVGSTDLPGLSDYGHVWVFFSRAGPGGGGVEAVEEADVHLEGRSSARRLRVARRVERPIVR